MTGQKPPVVIGISPKVRDLLVKYLETKPYKEVNNLIDLLGQGIQITLESAPEVAEEIADAEEVSDEPAARKKGTGRK